MCLNVLGAGRLPLIAKALPAQDWAVLRGAERNGSLLAALRADGGSLDAGVSLALRCADSRKAFRFAGLAAFGFVTKLLIVEEKLFTRGENKISTAIHALQGPILELHASSYGPSAARNTRMAARVLAP